ncbi:MAG: hypothetical protein FJW35_07425 [Acidobacteria bacterium]|nr:hypothetical protein [Acidobacteriota bacterium]
MRGVRARVDVLSEGEIDLIHGKSLELLSRTGLRVPNDAVMDIAERAGAVADRAAGILRIPSEAIEEMLAELRRTDSRSGEGLPRSGTGNPPGGAGTEPDLVEPLRGKISTQVHVVDYATGTRRRGTLLDLRRGIALVERLENFPRSDAVVLPQDLPAAISDIASFRDIYVYARKPGGTYVLSPGSADFILDMADAAGKEPSYLFETVSPLCFRRETLEIGLRFARRGRRLEMAPMVIAGATGPVTLAGMLTMQNAEVLASLFLIHALTGKWCGYVVGGHAMDMRSLLCSFGSPSQALIGMAAAQMARRYGLRAESNSGLTDSTAPDFQAGMEKALTAVFALLGGTRAIGCQGIVGADQGFSFEQLVLDDAWIGAYNHVLRGIDVSEETIGLRLMERIGVGGNFVAEKHTVKHLRDSFWFSAIYPRESWDESAGARPARALERARDFVAAATAAPLEPVLPAAKVEELDRIVAAARRSLVDAGAVQ